jgi:hypothetical protein
LAALWAALRKIGSEICRQGIVFIPAIRPIRLG